MAKRWTSTALGTPDDWIERNVYTRHSWEGVGLMLVVNLALFGPLGATIWAVQMAWIPVTAAGIINGIGHYWGYRNFSCEDASRNIVPWGILIGGEELHNNHHAYGTSAKLSSRWYEFDLGWAYIRTLEFFGLATVRKVAPRLKLDRAKLNADLETLQAIITHRYAVLTSYASSLKLAYRQEVASLRERARRGELTPDMPSFRRLRRWFQSDATALPETDRARLETTLEGSSALKTIYAMRQELAGAVGAFERFTRAAAGAPAGLVSSRRGKQHRRAAEVSRGPCAATRKQSVSRTMQKARRKAGFFYRTSRAEARLQLRHHLSFVSLYITCLRATGSNFLISIFSGISFLFFDVV